MAETVNITTVGHTVSITQPPSETVSVTVDEVTSVVITADASQTVTVSPGSSQTIEVGVDSGIFYNDDDARAAISATSPDLSYDSSTGVMSYNQQVVPIDKGGTNATDAATARSNIGADNASNLGKGLVPNARLTSVPVNTFSDVDVDKTANNIVYTDGSSLRSRAASNWNLTDFTNDLTSGDLPAHTHAASELTSGSLSISLIPDTDQAYDLGSADFRWADIHGDLDGPVIFRAKISGGGTLAVGDVVYIDGVNASGETPTVAKASASSASTMPAFGIISQGGSGSQDVHVTTLGSLTGIALPTPTYAVGDNVYVSTTAGQFTTSPPTGESNLIQNIGYVAKTHATNGILKVGGAGRTNAVPNLNDGNIFLGNASNQAVSTALSSVNLSSFNDDLDYAASTHTHLIADVTDISAFAATILDDADAAAVRTTIGAAATNHNHSAGQITSGTFDDARIASSNVTQHAGDINIGNLGDVTPGLLSDNLFLAYSTGSSAFTGRAPAAARTALGLGTAATSDTGDFAAASHTHAATDITSGTLDAARLPAISDAYIMVIETPSDQTYPLDPYMAEDRTISRLTVKTDSGTCSVLLAKNAGTSIGVLAASSSQNTTTTLANASCSAGDRLYITISSTSSADMLEIAVEYTQ